MKTIPLKVIETEPMLSQKKSPILSERNIVRISSSFRTKVILILTHILRQRLLRRQASLPGVLLGGRFHLLDHHKRTIHIRVHKWKFHYILNFSTKDFHSIFCLRKLFINLAGFIRNKAASSLNFAQQLTCQVASFTKGIQYSERVLRLATARETQKSYFSLCSFCFA